ncbi:YihY/virulence factor BrkB family protein [Nakamurella sp. PAMC28650]|uniref:YihY/virulence factor BrkB family protein n=1 Tax=Nakamurella sp. PAMC28650 TaxID=2762325 RepID=UPI0021039943|nr:YihY/virulence factor BrkB family protein [Nakamurella sp. PAMC28650]
MTSASHSDEERPGRLPTARAAPRATTDQYRRNPTDPDSSATVALHRPQVARPVTPVEHPGRSEHTATSPADNLTVPWHRLATGMLSSGPVPSVPPVEPPVRHRWRKVAGRTLSKAWSDSLFGMSSQAAFWSALSTAPLLLALLGSVGFVANWFGKDTINKVRDQIDIFLHGIFNQEVAQNLVGNTVDTILRNGQADVVSVGFVISLWAGSSAMSAFVESITIAYGQHEARHPVAERFFALGLYLAALVSGVFLLPLLAIGPTTLPELFPKNFQSQVSTIVGIVYYPVLVIGLVLLLATLYKLAPKHRHAWKRGLPGAFLAAAVFLVASFGLRLYLTYVYSHGLTYGALAVPITFLLFYYFVAMAIIIGAQFNNALLEYYPPKIPKREIRRWQRFDPERFDERGPVAE